MHGAISFEVKAVSGDDPNGSFEAILSMPTLDRDGEVVDARAFEPLPESIPVHKFHDFASPVAVAHPYYEGDVLKAKGTFDPDPEAQTIRSKVGRSIGFMSVGFMDADRADIDGVTHITRAELLEASFVSVPSNRQAAILAAKAYEERDKPSAVLSVAEVRTAEGVKAGARNSSKDSERLQSIHDLAVENGAQCSVEGVAPKSPDTDPEAKAAADAAATAPPADVPEGMAPRPMRVKAELLLLDV